MNQSIGRNVHWLKKSYGYYQFRHCLIVNSQSSHSLPNNISDTAKIATNEIKEYRNLINEFCQLKVIPAAPSTFNYSPGWTK